MPRGAGCHCTVFLFLKLDIGNMSDDGFVDETGEEEVDEEYTLAQELAALVSPLASCTLKWAASEIRIVFLRLI